MKIKLIPKIEEHKTNFKIFNEVEKNNLIRHKAKAHILLLQDNYEIFFVLKNEI